MITYIELTKGFYSVQLTHIQYYKYSSWILNEIHINIKSII